ncbi:hypothetical protein HRR83_005574 [Exophiala dermatitidis]|uniref:Sentrin-specific protease 7 n=2 Tax=Exophiala dermatitidis TaxID=5970 RepID=H6BW72_EXODN|nr:sentrin-specific protease 7 [Exophiala dermatitidis NIH/UT8656]KAJ4502476.1 hypothetical protein HRR75_008456 [Exophiala dermatitidis]EHY55172.1 sentrin-specific protease 7 [Exophiala dermatitidis NIH/UT8656]KAJ4503805.1 hypothetical protein HRR74_009196 [Exophiala dermatitidis]KAJ4508154.1 hypothetical protein HRR73_007593 [Exophiala dermatitidis]KAJ4531922.1 hypothetical protein HRR77_009053 [Exophiala dermatitidis]
MRTWNEPLSLVRDALQSFVTTIRSDSVPPGSDDNISASPQPNASVSQLHRAQMPPSPPRKYLTRNVKDYLQVNDNVPCDPIEIPSDEDGPPPSHDQKTKSPSRIPIQQARTKPTEIQVKRSESRDEARLLPTLTKRDPGAVTIPDPMKAKRFAQKPGYKVVNTLDVTKEGTRSRHIYEKTTNIRNPVDDNSHAHPVKKRKLDNNHSPDELRLSPEPSNGRIARSRRGSPRVIVSVPKYRQPAHDGTQAESQYDSRSSVDEGDFTKGAARERKALKDRILDSSPSTMSNTARTATVSSPYFETGDTPSRPLRHKVLYRDSPDALQADPPMLRQRQLLQSGTSADSWSIKDLGALIVGKRHKVDTPKIGNSATRQADKRRKSFKLEEVIHPNLPDANIYVVEVHSDSKEITFNTEERMLVDEPVLKKPRPISKISEVKHGTDESRVVLVTFLRQESYEDKMFLRFQSHKAAIDFVNALQQCASDIKVQCKSAEWMETAFAKARQDQANYDSSKLRSAGAAKEEVIPTKPSKIQSSAPNGEKHIRHVDRLDPPRPTPKPPTVISGAERRALGELKVPLPRDSTVGSRHGHSLDKNLDKVLEPRRVTRSHDNRKITSEKSIEELPPKRRPSATDALGEAWKKDLVYPGPGKKSATVPFEDLRRLDDDEFLNDNLISFFMQYLETYLERSNPELYRDMYFFNTYFYEALTKNVKGKKGINYDAVSRWTKNINIFKRKFVVVPVNENFHWYLAIICNLPYFLPKAESDGENEARHGHQIEVVEDSQSSDRHSEGTGDAPTQATEATQKSLAELSLSDYDEGNSSSISKGQPKKGPGRRKAPRRSLPKYDVDKPIIITLDSLGLSRSATCSLLRQYVVAEAKAKQGLDIDGAELRGMTAKDIPTQSNFSDCGLYLCMYLEQFVANPSQFVSNILRREEEAQQWPRKIRSEDLRSRLRELILELHRRQEGQKPTVELPEVGSIMIEKRKPSPAPLSAVHDSGTKRSKQEIAEARQRFQDVADARHTVRQEESSTRKPDDKRSDPYEAETPIIISTEKGPRDCGLRPVKHGAHGTLQLERDKSGAEVLITASPPLGDNHRSGADSARTKDKIATHSSPAELAADLRQRNETRDAGKRKRRSSSTSSSDDHFNNSERRNVQSNNASTEFLSGLESYALYDRSSPSMQTHRQLRDTKSQTVSPLKTRHGHLQPAHATTKVLAEVTDDSDEDDDDDAVVVEMRHHDESGDRRRKRRRNDDDLLVAGQARGQKAQFQNNNHDSEPEVPETQETSGSSTDSSESYGDLRGHGHQRKDMLDDEDTKEMLLR